MTDYAEHLNALSGLMADHYGYRTPASDGPQGGYTTADVTARMSMSPDGPPAASSTTGSWGNPPETRESAWIAHARAIDDYIRGLPGRAMVNNAEGARRMVALGNAGIKEQVRDMFGVGHGVDAYDAAREGRYLDAAGNVALGALDLTAPISSPAVATTDAALRAWQAANAARPAQVAEELAKLTTKRMKTTGPAAERRAAAAERAIPEPAMPGGRSAEEAQRMLDVASRTWPGNIGAGVGVAGGATGIPGVMMDDAKSAVDPVHAMQRDMAQESVDRGAPFRPEAAPQIAFYQKQLDEARRARNINMGYAGAETAGGVGATYGAMKTTPWAFRGAMPGLVGLGAQIAADAHPLIGLPIMAAGALPLALPAGLGYASWKAANAIPDNIKHALEAHAKAKTIEKILDNYREQPKPPSLTSSDRDYHAELADHDPLNPQARRQR